MVRVGSWAPSELLIFLSILINIIINLIFGWCHTEQEVCKSFFKGNVKIFKKFTMEKLNSIFSNFMWTQ